jgi:hypothetical protein
MIRVDVNVSLHKKNLIIHLARGVFDAVDNNRVTIGIVTHV